MSSRTVTLATFLAAFSASTGFSQNSPVVVSPQYDSLSSRVASTALGSGKAYELLYELTTTIGHRLSGSPQAARAVEWAKKKMEESGLENVHLESVTVPHWVRGSTEEASVLFSDPQKTIQLNVTALGGSIGTPGEGITAEVIEVKSFEELRAL